MVKMVVGVDGSTGADRALHFAIDEARLRGATLRIVMAWYVESMAYAGLGGFGPSIDPAALEERIRAQFDHILDTVGEQAKDVQVEGVLAMGKPVAVLIEEAPNADLLVVGSRGHRGFAELLLGSVGHQCALHAPCPIVPDPA